MEPTLTLVEAATRTGRSRAALQRLAAGGAIAGATKVGRGWRLPVSSLLAAGIEVHDAPVRSPEARVESAQRELDDARAEAERHRQRVEDLLAQNADLRRHIDDLRETLATERRALMVAQPEPSEDDRPTAVVTVEENAVVVVDEKPFEVVEARRRRWWQRSPQ